MKNMLSTAFLAALLLSACADANAAPAIALVAAYSSVSAGVGMLAAGGLSAVLGGAMVVGGVMTGLGVLTKNEKLSKIGGVLSLAGGIGNLAANALKTGAQTAAGGMTGAAAEGGTASTQLSQTAASSGTSAGAASTGGALAGDAAGAAGAAGAGATTAAASPLAQSGGALSADAGSMYSAGATQGGNSLAAGGIGETAAAGAQASGAGTTSVLKNMSGSIADFVKQNKELVSAASGIIGGAMKSYQESKALEQIRKDEEKRRRQYNDSMDFELNRMHNPDAQVHGVLPPAPVGQFVPRQQAAQAQQQQTATRAPRQAGFINRAMGAA